MHPDTITEAMQIRLQFDKLPDYPNLDPNVRRAPYRRSSLSTSDLELALRNALRYVPTQFHAEIAPEFMKELKTHGRIYGYRFRPAGKLYGKPVDEYESACLEGKAFQVMIDNNLDFDVALYPYELVTYGETGQVCQNWMQYLLIKEYLKVLTHANTLVVQSGHPLGLFKSHPGAPRVIITNGLMVGFKDNYEDWARAAALGVANYGQMTAGGWMYIGPQGIVHGTFNTIMLAGRIELSIPADGNLSGKLFVTSGLGGMSSAQGKAVKIAKSVGIIAEVDGSKIDRRLAEESIDKVAETPQQAFDLASEAQGAGVTLSIAYRGNIVDLLAYADEHECHIDLLSDQTSCHAAYDGGYCPQGFTYDQAQALMAEDRDKLIAAVDASLLKHYRHIRSILAKTEAAGRKTFFFDYGNSFLKAIFDAQKKISPDGSADIARNGIDERDGFIYPSYVENILGPELFDYGYGPFRWVCLSGKNEDLDKTDAAAADVISTVRPTLRAQDIDNMHWVRDAKANKLVVGTRARILYQDAKGRAFIALRFNQMVRDGEIGPVMLGRDHHDTGGTDSPFRETANVLDGSNIMADMATHCFAGNAARGMSLVTLHNGGGVGIGKAINGGFGLVLDGSDRVDEIIKSAMSWDVMGGVARRAWARNPNSMEVAEEFNREHAGAQQITLPYVADDELVKSVVANT
ncbi:urocanate hydratase [Calditrichota bacterium]